jgi:hypothetical protein
MEQQWRKAVSLQRKRAVMACFRMVPVYNISRLVLCIKTGLDAVVILFQRWSVAVFRACRFFLKMDCCRAILNVTVFNCVLSFSLIFFFDRTRSDCSLMKISNARTTSAGVDNAREMHALATQQTENFALFYNFKRFDI